MNRLRPTAASQIDGPTGPWHLRCRGGVGPRWFLWIIAVLVTGGCASSGPAVVASVADPEDLAFRTEEATRIPHPQRIVFRWRLAEAGMRFQGRGVARMEPPHRVRLDLFTTGGETLFQAALVGQDLRIPPWAPRELAPPSALMWASVGVFRPDADLSLLEGSRLEGGAFLLRYGAGREEELWFRVKEGRLTRAEIRLSGHLAKEVQLAFDGASKTVQETTYRDHEAFRELKFELESIERVEPFPPFIWMPGG